MKDINLFCSFKKSSMKDIIFDADGVILLSTEIGINSLIEAAKICRLRVPSIKQVKVLWGHHLESEMIPALKKELDWPENSEPLILNAFHDISLKCKYPEQKTLADKLLAMSKRCKLGIASNRDIQSLVFRLEEQGIDPALFSHIQTADAGVSKPDPRVFSSFWNGAGFRPNRTVFIGDSITYDLAAAKAHQPELAFAAITSGMHSFGEFMRAGVKCQNIFKTTERALDSQYLFC